MLKSPLSILFVTFTYNCIVFLGANLTAVIVPIIIIFLVLLAIILVVIYLYRRYTTFVTTVISFNVEIFYVITDIILATLKIFALNHVASVSATSFQKMMCIENLHAE